MGGVGYGLITIVVFGSSDVVVENPVLASHALAEVCWLVEAFCTVRYREGVARQEAQGL